MMTKMIENAFGNGAEVIVYMRGVEEPFRGRIQDVQDGYFSLYHNGCCQGMLWTLRLDDILAGGLVVPIPTCLRELAEPGAYPEDAAAAEEETSLDIED